MSRQGLLGFIGLALILISPSLAFAANPYLHYFDCKNCHFPNASMAQMSENHVCLKCHDATPPYTAPDDKLLDPIDAARGAGPGQINWQSGAGFSTGDASNSFGHNPAPGQQSSHNWTALSAQPAAGAQEPNRSLYTGFYSRYGASLGKVTCSRCHNPHGEAVLDANGDTIPDNPLANPKLLAGDSQNGYQPMEPEKLCRACHEVWANTNDHGWLTHPLIADYAVAAGAKPGYKPAQTVVDAAAQAAIDGRSAVNLISYQGKTGIGCLSCHGVHYVDSDAGTADGVGASLSPGDGKLLRAAGPGRADKSGLCQSCHTYQAHGDNLGEKVGCLVCHGGHAYDPTLPNYFILRKTATTTTYGTKSGLDYSSPGVLNAATKYLFWNDLLNNTTSGYCEKCHGDAQSIPDGGGGYHKTNAVCTRCHGHSVSGEGSFVADCIGCHSVAQGTRVAVVGQFAGNSHHVQGSALNNQHCYQCHWEADSNGKINPAYHNGENPSGAPVDLVIYGAGFRPTTYTAGTTAIQYTANGNRTEISKLNTHCLGCHNDANNTTTPFGDGKTPRQYAWDNTSVASRYSQAGTTPWGKYSGANVTPKNTQSKAYSAHGNATANQGGWDLGETWANTRPGAVNVACYDCHNSHGSNAAGKTSSYTSATVNGGLLKDTEASKGGYTATYKPVAGGTAGTNNVRNAGASLCFDCHLNAASSASKPWGYQSTFGATQPILGYYDTPDLAPGNAGSEQRYPYKAIPEYKGGHFGASSPLKNQPASDHSINGLCTPCHDPHGVSPSLGANQQYGVPLLKGTWLTSPYKEDVAPEYNYTQLAPGNYLHIDQNTFGNYWDLNTLVVGITQNDTQFAGLCLTCHPKTSLTGASRTWKSKDRVHETVKGWKAANVKHNFSCSKCHTPHIGSSLPRLMVTNCLDPTHKERTGGIPYPATSGSGDGGSGRIPGSNACHEGNTGAGTDQSWNLLTPWYEETATLAITSGPTAVEPQQSAISWGTSIPANSFVDYGPTAAYGLTAVDGTWVTNHNVGVAVGFWPTGLPNHSTYHYRVRSTSVKGQQVTSSDRTAYLNVPPSAPTPSSPRYAWLTCAGTCSISFSWTAATDPDGGPIQYYVEIDNNWDFSSPEMNSGWINTTSVNIGPLATETYWYWRVKARDANHPEVVSTSWAPWFRTAQPAPTTPTNLTTPANPSCVGSCSVDLSWTASSNGGPGPFQYYVQVDDDPAFATPNVILPWVTGTVAGSTVTASAGPLATAKTWYWRVKGRDAGYTAVESAYSARTSFVLLESAPIPGVPVPSNEPNLPCTGSCTVNLAWSPGINNPVYGAVEYELQVDDDAGFGSIDANPPWTTATNAEVSLSVSLPTVDKLWYFRVRARYQSDPLTPSGWSAAKSFHVVYPVPSTPTGLVAPVDTVCPGGCSLDLYWNASTSYGGGPFEYTVEVDDVTTFNGPGKKVRTWDPAATATIAFAPADVGRTWYWRVQARDTSNLAAVSAWSSTASFRVLTVAPPPPPAIISHGSFDSGCVNTLVTVSWNPVASPDGDPVQYYVHTDNFGDSGWLPAGTTSWSFTMYAAWGVTWQVMARDAVHQDASSAWSAAEYFYDVGSGCWTSSCPLVFGWTGDRYAYMTDLAGPVLALRAGATDRSVTNFHAEVAAVNGLVPGSDGQYHVKIRESLPEITYLDTATLLAVDAPEGYEVHTSWGEATYVYGYANPFKVYTVKAPLSPVAAYDRNGNDVLPAMLAVDNTPAHLDPFDTGFYYTVDFGLIEHQEYAKLLIDGWTLFGSESLPATQLVAPSIWVVDQAGNWVKVKSFGTPTGDLKTMVVDLANVFPSNDHRIRIYTGMRPKSRWLIDRIRLDQSAPVEVSTLELPAMAADLQFGGNAIHAMSNLNSRIIATDATLPVETDYPSYGNFTRYGDVTPLLSSSDNKFAIMREGDKVEVSFPVPSPPQAGFWRNFFVKSDLYYKSLRVTNTVEPLPFHGMSGYPYPATESYPQDAEHLQYLEEYNTRVISP